MKTRAELANKWLKLEAMIHKEQCDKESLLHASGKAFGDVDEKLAKINKRLDQYDKDKICMMRLIDSTMATLKHIVATLDKLTRV